MKFNQKQSCKQPRLTCLNRIKTKQQGRGNQAKNRPENWATRPRQQTTQIIQRRRSLNRTSWWSAENRNRTGEGEIEITRISPKILAITTEILDWQLEISNSTTNYMKLKAGNNSKIETLNQNNPKFRMTGTKTKLKLNLNLKPKLNLL